MSNWHQGRLCLLDFETTGIDPHRDRVVTAAIIEVGGGQQTRTSEWLVKPGITIPDEAAAVHGITTEHAESNGVDAAGAIHEIAEHLLRLSANGVPIVGHNVCYDLTLLWAECVRHNTSFGPNTSASADLLHIAPVIDTAVIEKHLDPYRPGQPNGRRPDNACGSHRLIDCCRLWGVELSEQDAHGAAADALAAGRLAWQLAAKPDRFAQFDSRPVDRIDPAALPLNALHTWQRNEKARQAASLADWFRKQGKDEHVSTEWPIQAAPAGWSPDQAPVAREDGAA